jgi:serralysin
MNALSWTGNRRLVATAGLMVTTVVGAVIAVSPAGATSGALDLGFAGASHGRMTADLGSPGSLRGMAIQQRGGIFIAGVQGSAAVVFRLHADGRRDAAFGQDGLLRLPDDAGTATTASAVVMNRYGSVVVVGQVGEPTGDLADVGVWQFGSDGKPDPRLGGGEGFVQLGDPGVQDLSCCVDIDAEGRIVVVGTTGTADPDITVTRLTQDGTPDGSFNNGSRSSSATWGSTSRALPHCRQTETS